MWERQILEQISKGEMKGISFFNFENISKDRIIWGKINFFNSTNFENVAHKVYIYITHIFMSC